MRYILWFIIGMLLFVVLLPALIVKYDWDEYTRVIGECLGVIAEYFGMNV